jgi:hypothetical protein
MRRALPLAVLLTLFVAADASAASRGVAFAFGRVGGNIRPYTVTIASSGAVIASGPVNVGTKMLTSVQLRNLDLVAAKAQFAHLPASRSCPGALPDIAYTFIRVGSHAVRVRGGCVPAYTRLWNALARAVRLSNS